MFTFRPEDFFLTDMVAPEEDLLTKNIYLAHIERIKDLTESRDFQINHSYLKNKSFCSLIVQVFLKSFPTRKHYLSTFD